MAVTTKAEVPNLADIQQRLVDGKPVYDQEDRWNFSGPDTAIETARRSI